MGVCAWEREREWDRKKECEKERENVCVCDIECVYLGVRERKRERVSEIER